MPEGSGGDERSVAGRGRRRRPRPDAELDEDVGDVELGGAHADEERLGDFAVGLPGDEEAQDLDLAQGQGAGGEGGRGGGGDRLAAQAAVKADSPRAARAAVTAGSYLARSSGSRCAKPVSSRSRSAAANSRAAAKALSTSTAVQADPSSASMRTRVS